MRKCSGHWGFEKKPKVAQGGEYCTVDKTLLSHRFTKTPAKKDLLMLQGQQTSPALSNCSVPGPPPQVGNRHRGQQAVHGSQRQDQWPRRGGQPAVIANMGSGTDRQFREHRMVCGAVQRRGVAAECGGSPPGPVPDKRVGGLPPQPAGEVCGVHPRRPEAGYWSFFARRAARLAACSRSNSSTYQ